MNDEQLNNNTNITAMYYYKQNTKYCQLPLIEFLTSDPVAYYRSFSDAGDDQKKKWKRFCTKWNNYGV